MMRITGDTLALTPPLIISETQIAELIDKVRQVIRAVQLADRSPRVRELMRMVMAAQASVIANAIGCNDRLRPRSGKALEDLMIEIA